ncbi:hypothetical protein DFJ43DRAFT_1161856 [Lentinula guzmanii]|uniref:Uncharacterized protein n=1 Tax=Lentinula guzmanii TaxID=2804957 RepID=A0AA38MTX2_9AGAR|nr:hypothetical protein DFJ43DRAFT_1161856 [Lentinula guzmanii]
MLQLPVCLILGQPFRGIGQVGGVAISSAIFQWKLDGALREQIDGPDAEQIITWNISDRTFPGIEFTKGNAKTETPSVDV